MLQTLEIFLAAIGALAVLGALALAVRRLGRPFGVDAYILAAAAVFLATAITFVVTRSSFGDEKVAAVTLVVGGLATLGWLYTLVQLGDTAKRADDHAIRRDQRRLAAELIRTHLLDPTLIEVRRLVSQRFLQGKRVPEEAVQELLDDWHGENGWRDGAIPTMSAIQRVLNFFEALAIMIETGMLDERDVRPYFSSIVTASHEKFRHVIYHLQHPHGQRANASFVSFVRLAERWDGENA